MKIRKRNRTSAQRERILELLRSTDTHPTVDWIYAQLKNEFPKLSLGTVYRNVRILVEQGLLQRLPSGSTFDRYDGNVAPHYHVICNRCGRMFDLHIPLDSSLEEKARQMSQFLILGHRVEFYGICTECQSKQNGG